MAEDDDYDYSMPLHDPDAPNVESEVNIYTTTSNDTVEPDE